MKCEHDWVIDPYTYSDKVVKFCKLCKTEIVLQRCENKMEVRKMNKSEIKLGDNVKDNVTGVQGKVTGICEYLSETTRGIVEYLNKDGDVQRYWIGIDRLEKCDTNSGDTGLSK